MPKATSLTPEALELQRVITPLAATKARGENAPTGKDANLVKPLQIRPTKRKGWEIKMAAADEELSLTDFMLLCFDEHMEKRKHGSM